MKILVIEDDELTAGALASVLTGQNYTVEVATDGEEGWELIEAFAYDLILLDVTLPKLDGISLCRRLRSRGYQLPILLLTAHDSGHDKAVGLDAGADDYVVKPFDPEELVARIRALLRRGQAISRTVLEWGALKLDPVSCEVIYGTQLLTLTPKEYALLELFLRNPRRVFSCGAILENLWSLADIPGEEAVRTHIKGLRQKLKVAGASDLIETVYGIGYRLKSQEPSPGKQPKTKPKTPPSDSTPPSPQPNPQQTLAAIAEVWQRFQPRITEQVEVLEQAATASLQQSLSPTLRQQAEQTAHTLAGSLGTFGFEVGSQLARTIEQLLKVHDPLQNEVIRLLVSALRQEIAAPPVSPEPAIAPSKASAERSFMPIMLVISSDRALTQPLAEEATNWGLCLELDTNLDRAITRLQSELPSIVVLDLARIDSTEDCLALLTQHKQQIPSVPVLVILTPEQQNSLCLIQTSQHVLLPLPIRPAQVLQEALRLLHQINPVEANILVVDDDPQLLAAVRTILQPWGLHVATLSDPQRFWETLETTRPDLLILDLKMPQVSGIELCQSVRDHNRWSGLPIVILTAYGDARTVNQVFAAGADDFVSKPIVGPELVTRILNRLERVRLLKTIAPQHTEAGLRKAKDELEMRVAERTAELISVNERLCLELKERQRIEEDLRVSEARFSGILEIADDAIISVNANQIITLFNQGAEKIFGYTAQEALGKPLDLLLPSRFVNVHRRHVAEFGHSFNHARRMGERQEVYGRRKNGEEFPSEASISKLELAGEAIFTVILRDVSDRRIVERMKDEFVSVVSHELRTPLTSIHGSLGMLASGLLDAEPETGKRLLEIAVDSTERLVRLINDVLDVERIESGKITMAKQVCDVADLMNNAVNVMQAMAEKFDITLSVTTLSTQLYADPDRIIQTLTNLLSNAIKFSPRGAIVWLTAKHQDDQIIFQVKDQGRGIPADKLETIFERFQQVDASDSRNHEGTGLGLAICRSIIQQHGGHIWVESCLGEGSTFYFTLPVTDAERNDCREE